MTVFLVLGVCDAFIFARKLNVKLRMRKDMNQDFLSKLRSLLSISLFIFLVSFIGYSSWQLLNALIAKFS
jgi:hypothetical protein